MIDYITAHERVYGKVKPKILSYVNTIAMIILIEAIWFYILMTITN